MKHVQLSAFISYRKEKSKEIYHARLSVFETSDSNDTKHTINIFTGDDVIKLQVDVLRKWDEVSKSIKLNNELNFCNDRMTTYKYRSNKLIRDIVTYNLI